jgi:hypothetical protein
MGSLIFDFDVRLPFMMNLIPITKEAKAIAIIKPPLKMSVSFTVLTALIER